MPTYERTAQVGFNLEHRIKNSLAYRADNNTCIYKTFSTGLTDTSQYKKTFSIWFKMARVGLTQILYCNAYGDSNNQHYLYLTSSDNLIISCNYGGVNIVNKVTSRIFRDTTNWYHLVLGVDTTNATAEDRHILWINGVRVTSFSSNTNCAQNSLAMSFMAQAIGYQHVFGRNSLEAANYFRGNFAFIEVVDGLQLSPTAFGYFDSVTRQWKHRPYRGAWGNQGFRLNFYDATSLTTLGYDSSGNGHNWTTNGFNLSTSDWDYCIHKDVPDNNYNRFNYIGENCGTAIDYAAVLYSNNEAGNYWRNYPTTFNFNKGKWYCEFHIWCVGAWSDTVAIGISEDTNNIVSSAGFFGSHSTSYGWHSNAYKYNVTATAWGVQIGADGNNIIKMAVDLDNGKIWWGDATYGWWGSGNPETGANPAFTFTADQNKYYIFGASIFSRSGATSYGQVKFNSGFQPFAMTPPSGYKTMCADNMPVNAIVDAKKYFDIDLYIGNATARDRTGFKFKPGFLWHACRGTSGYHHAITDRVRGATKMIYSSTTLNEQTDATSVTSFNADGYSIGSCNSQNANAQTFAAWMLRDGGAAVANNSGSIQSSVSVDTKMGFSIVSYTGTGANATVGHGLTKTPKFIVVFNLDYNGYSSPVYHQDVGATAYLLLNSNTVSVTDSTLWNNTAPTANVFSVGTNAAVNANTQRHIAYCFAEIQGFSRISYYDAYALVTIQRCVLCGFTPKFVMIKKINNTNMSWWIHDTSRRPENQNGVGLQANTYDAEVVDNVNYGIDIVSNGFKIKTTNDAWGGSGRYIYIAIADLDFRNSNAR